MCQGGRLASHDFEKVAQELQKCWLQSPRGYKGLSRKEPLSIRIKSWKRERNFWEPLQLSDEKWTYLVKPASQKLSQLEERLKNPSEIKPFLAVWRIKDLFGHRKHKKSMKMLGLLDEKFKPIVLRNIPNDAQKLNDIKHLIDVMPIDKAETASDLYLEQMEYNKNQLEELEKSFDPEWELKQGSETVSPDCSDSFHIKWQLSERTVMKNLWILKNKSLLFKEYFPAVYTFKDRANTTIPAAKGQVNRRKMF
ncbi:MAG: 39S ribosomal protein L30, mitochondrial [Paramarteilia canceri]